MKNFEAASSSSYLTVNKDKEISLKNENIESLFEV